MSFYSRTCGRKVNGVRVYLVGGAVRDQLLGLPVHERDWVVVGASPQQLLDLGYRPVGKDFPVFLHPDSQEEYALARTERKIGPGYTGFDFYAAPDVTLEQDLARRDLTINAIAQDDAGNLIDPFGGQNDLTQKILRHVSPAFIEDPVRILRVARFAARFADFSIHPDTLRFMREMVQQGEVNALVAERVWQELERALAEAHPERFFAVLAECGALEILFPQVHFALTALSNAAKSSFPLTARFAALTHTLTKTAIDTLCERYRIPRAYRDLAVLIAEHCAIYPGLLNINAESLLSLLESLDAFRRSERLEPFMLSCAAIYDDLSWSEKLCFINEAYAIAKSVVPETEGLTGVEIKADLRAKRIAALTGSMRVS